MLKFSKSLAPVALAFAASFAVSSAQAQAIIIDDFGLPIPGVTIFDASNAAGVASVVTANPSANAISRTLQHELLTGGVNNATGTFSNAGVGAPDNFAPNELNMSNAPQVDSIVHVEWVLGALTATATNFFAFDVTFNDNGVLNAQNTAEAFLNGASLGVANLSVGTISFGLDAMQAGSLATAGQIFKLQFNGAAGWDASLDDFRLVPEPTSLALAGLALVGLGVARRRAARK